jgi:hypothetical protein
MIVAILVLLAMLSQIAVRDGVAGKGVPAGFLRTVHISDQDQAVPVPSCHLML